MTQFRPGNFQALPPVIKNLLIINVLFFIAQNTLGNSGFVNLDDLLALHNIRSPLFKPWQIITHLFMHGSFWHLFFNMLALWMIGPVLENLWGAKRFFTFYFVCGIGAALLHLTFLWFDSVSMVNQFVLIKQAVTPAKASFFFNEFHLDQYYRVADDVLNSYLANPDDIVARKNILEMTSDFTYAKLSTPTVGASGAISGLLAAFIYLFPNTEFLFYFFIPMKAKWLGVLYFGSELYFAITNSQGDNVAHWAHLGGALVGFLLVLTWNRTRRTFF